MTFNQSKARYEEILRKAQEARDAEKKREAEAKARQQDWNGRASNTIQNMTNSANKVLGELPVRIDDARDGKGLVIQMRTLDDKKHAELKIIFTEDYSKKLVTARLFLEPDDGTVSIELPELPASPQPSFDKAKRDMESVLSGMLEKFFDRIIELSAAAGLEVPMIAAPSPAAVPAIAGPVAAPAGPVAGPTPAAPVSAPAPVAAQAPQPKPPAPAAKPIAPAPTPPAAGLPPRPAPTAPAAPLPPPAARPATSSGSTLPPLRPLPPLGPLGPRQG